MDCLFSDIGSLDYFQDHAIPIAEEVQDDVDIWLFRKMQDTSDFQVNSNYIFRSDDVKLQPLYYSEKSESTSGS